MKKQHSVNWPLFPQTNIISIIDIITNFDLKLVNYKFIYSFLIKQAIPIKGETSLTIFA